MKKYVDKDKLQEFATKLHNKQKTIFATRESIAPLVGSPLVASTAADMTDTTKVYVYVGSETGYTSGNWYYYDGSAWTSGGVYNSTALETDDTLSVAGMAADSKAVGDALAEMNDGLTDDIKQALLQIASKVAYIDEDGQNYYDALEAALYPDATLEYISAVYTQSGTVYDTDSLDSLKTDLVVTAHYDDYSAETVTAYTLSGTLTAGTSAITVSYGGKTTTFNVTVAAAPLYAFENAVTETVNYRITTTKGGHFKLEVLNNMTTSNAGFAVNMYTRELGDLGGNNSVVNNKPKVFTLPANKTIVNAIENVNDTTGLSNNAISYKIANSGSSVENIAVHTDTGFTATLTLTNNTDVGCPFMYIYTNHTTLYAGSIIEFDLSLTVDGERYI